MSVELVNAWEAAAHLLQLVAEHALVEAGKKAVGSAAKAVVGWLHRHLPEDGQRELTAVLAAPGPGPAKNALEARVATLLETRPDLFDALRALLKQEEAGSIMQTMTLGDNNKGVVQNTGDNVTVHVSG